jgi:glycerol-3-phosphate dehydrogenase (NAD(P)+)
MRAAVMGAGAWGTTFAQVLCDAGTSTVLYARRPELTKALRELHENPDYLPGITLTPVLEATSDAVSALDGADVVACPRSRCVPICWSGSRSSRRARCWSA